MRFTDAVKSVFSQYVGFSGRALRSEFWYFHLFTLIVVVALNVVGAVLGLGASFFISFYVLTFHLGFLGLIFHLAIFLPSLAVTVRRFHDVNKSGWWILIVFTIIGIIPSIYWMCKKGDECDNRFGPPPSVSQIVT